MSSHENMFGTQITYEILIILVACGYTTVDVWPVTSPSGPRGFLWGCRGFLGTIAIVGEALRLVGRLGALP